MAKPSAHGVELWREERLTSRKAYMADGKILINSGSGTENPGVYDELNCA